MRPRDAAGAPTLLRARRQRTHFGVWALRTATRHRLSDVTLTVVCPSPSTRGYTYQNAPQCKVHERGACSAAGWQTERRSDRDSSGKRGVAARGGRMGVAPGGRLNPRPHAVSHDRSSSCMRLSITRRAHAPTHAPLPSLALSCAALNLLLSSPRCPIP